MKDESRAPLERDRRRLVSRKPFPFFIFALVTGRIDAIRHNAALQSLIDYLSAERATRPHLGEFLDQWRSSQRPAAIFVPVPTTE